MLHDKITCSRLGQIPVGHRSTPSEEGRTRWKSPTTSAPSLHGLTMRATIGTEGQILLSRDTASESTCKAWHAIAPCTVTTKLDRATGASKQDST